MQKANVVIGKEYRVGEDKLGWFIPGAIIAIVSDYDMTDTMRARGPAIKDGVAGLSVSRGDSIEGYVSVSMLEEIEVPVVEPVHAHVSLNANSTTIVIQKRLTVDEMHAVLTAANV